MKGIKTMSRNTPIWPAVPVSAKILMPMKKLSKTLVRGKLCYKPMAF
jgi:hypothetical protein